MKPTHPLEIHIFTADGEEHSFYVDDPQDVAIIQRTIVPSRIFAQKQFVVAGSYFMAGFMSSEVTRVDFAAKDWELPVVPGAGEGREITQISDKEMARRCLPRFTDPKRQDIQAAPGSTIETFAEFGLVDGNRVCCRIASRAGGKLDQRQFIQNITAGQGFVIERTGGGYIVLNPTLISRWALYPGLPELPLNTWKAHRLETEVDAHPSLVFKKISLKELEAEDEDE